MNPILLIRIKGFLGLIYFVLPASSVWSLETISEPNQEIEEISGKKDMEELVKSGELEEMEIIETLGIMEMMKMMEVIEAMKVL